MTTITPLPDAPPLAPDCSAAAAGPTADEREAFGVLVDDALATLHPPVDGETGEPDADESGDGDGGEGDAGALVAAIASAFGAPPPAIAVHASAGPGTVTPEADATAGEPAIEPTGVAARTGAGSVPMIEDTTIAIDPAVDPRTDASPTATTAPVAALPPGPDGSSAATVATTATLTHGAGDAGGPPVAGTDEPGDLRTDAGTEDAGTTSPTPAASRPGEPQAPFAVATAVLEPPTDARDQRAAAPSTPAPEPVDAPTVDALADGQPWAQVARAVRGARHHADGSQTLTVRLDPPELGSVQIDLRMHDGRLSIHATADSLSTRDALQRALPDLRASLDAGGVNAGSIDVDARASGDAPGRRDADAAPDRAPGGRAARNVTATSGPGIRVAAGAGPVNTAPSTSRLDLRL